MADIDEICDRIGILNDGKICFVGTPEELKNYYLHDSSILEMKKIDNSINLKIEYCLFMQDDYVEGTDETCILNLKFNDATANIESISDNTIIDTKISDTSITFNLELDDNDEFIQLTIEASSVDISKDK